MKERKTDIVRYEIHWITATGKHCVAFGSEPDENGERGKLLEALKSDPAVILVQTRKITTEIL